MVRHILDRLVVMCLESIVEIADREELYTKMAYPYTQALLSSMLESDPTNAGKERIELTSTLNSLYGCQFAIEKCT